DKYADDRAVSMQLLDTPPAPLTTPRTVLLITGVTIPAASFDPIKLRLERDGFKTVVYEPPDLLSGDLFENSDRLKTVVDQIVASSGENKIDILAECTGGLIARHYIQALGGDEHVHRLVTFISPQHGIEKAPIAAAYAQWPALYDLSPGSAFLETVNNAPLPPTVDVTSVYTCTDEYIQPYTTSIIPGATNIGVACNGELIGHFDFFYNTELYRVMHDALVRPLTHPDPIAPTPNPTPDPQDPQPSPGDDQDASMDAGGGCSTGGDAGFGAMMLIAVACTVRRYRTHARR
ncbi:MAG TPA: hypothetical protein VGM39_00030, partial [Kofleriaceae bacterium]